MSEVPAPFDRHRETVLPEWIDYNGHMNVGYYGIAFDRATDTFFDFVGIGEGYRRTTGLSLFAVEQHSFYQAELRLGDPLRITTQLLGCDAKRIHFFHRMYHAGTGQPAACIENLGLNIDMGRRKAAEFPADIQARLAAVLAAHAAVPRPAEAGRRIALLRR
jgi:acyl-CoA thioester hydrolase